MESDEPAYPWVRRDDESSRAYTDFQAYLHLGPTRSILKAATELGKTEPNLKNLSRKYDWVKRCKAYDRYVTTAETDGFHDKMAASRDENLELISKLRKHLSDRLDQFIEQNVDPTIRWTQALGAMAKVETNTLLRNDDRTSERIERIEELVEKALRLDMETE
jgi:hypothetical protein